MVWYLIGVYIIKRTLHDRLEKRNFSSRFEKTFHSLAALTREIFFNTRREISLSPRGHVISSIYADSTTGPVLLNIFLSLNGILPN